MKQKLHIPGELALILAVLINSFGVVLMLYSGSGISAISSVPYAFSKAFPFLSLGTWNYCFQGILILTLMLLRKRFVLPYLFSFAVGFGFSGLLDVHEAWIGLLPRSLPCSVAYFLASYVLIAWGIAVSNRCLLPIIPTDLFPREMADITKITYSRVKITFDISCLTITALITFFFLGRIDGLGVGTAAAAFTTGKAVALVGKWLDKRVDFFLVTKNLVEPGRKSPWNSRNGRTPGQPAA